MSFLSPTALYHAELREQLGSVGRALALQRAVLWLVRGLALGLVLDLGLTGWERWQTSGVSLPLLSLAPISVAAVAALLTLLVRLTPAELAQRVDRAAALQERAVTALELGTSNAQHPLAVAQMRDAVENLRRLQKFQAFPCRVPRRELLVSGLLVAGTMVVAFSPNAFITPPQAVGVREAAVADQAQRVERLAQTMQAQPSPVDQQVGGLLGQTAQTMRSDSSHPDSALTALQDLENQLSEMGSGDRQLAAALAAASSSLAAEPATQELAQAIQSGDMRQVGAAANQLAQQTQQMDAAQQSAVAQALRNAASAATNASPSTAAQLSAAATALQSSADASAAASQAGTTSQGGPAGQTDPTGESRAADQSAADALNGLADNASGAGARQLASDQLQSSANAIERAAGQAQGTSATTGQARSSGAPSSSARSSAASTGSQATNPAGQAAGQDQASGQGAGQDQVGGQGQSDGQDQANAQGQAGAQDQAAGDQGGGPSSGYSPGGQNANNSAAPTRIDTSGDLQHVPSPRQTPDQSQADPNLSSAAPGTASASDQAVTPRYSNQPTQGGDNQDIPIGLRDLVRDYFSSQGQN